MSRSRSCNFCEAVGNLLSVTQQDGSHGVWMDGICHRHVRCFSSLFLTCCSSSAHVMLHGSAHCACRRALHRPLHFCHMSQYRVVRSHYVCVLRLQFWPFCMCSLPLPLPQAEPRKCQRLSKRGSHFVGSAWGKWQDCEVEVEPLQCLGCSSVQRRHELRDHRLSLSLSQARLAQSAERKALNFVVVGSSSTVGVGAHSNM